REVASNPTPSSMRASNAGGEALFGSRAASRRKARAGLDVLLTKAAIDFQNLSHELDDASLRQNLEALREAAGLDAILIAIFDEAKTSIESVAGASALFCTFNPEVLKGESLERLPYLRSRLEHLRIAELRDTSQPRRQLAPEAAYLSSLHVGAALIVGVAMEGQTRGFIALCSTLPRDSWDANLHLMLKLLGSSYATGVERLRYQRRFEQIEERNELALYGANDGLWDCDLEGAATYFSPRWKAMVGYTDEDVESLSDWRKLVHPDDLPRVQQALRDHLSGKEPMFESVHRLRHRDGVWLWVVSRAKARIDEQ